jgi:hypothetical protein
VWSLSRHATTCMTRHIKWYEIKIIFSHNTLQETTKFETKLCYMGDIKGIFQKKKETSKVYETDVHMQGIGRSVRWTTGRYRYERYLYSTPSLPRGQTIRVHDTASDDLWACRSRAALGPAEKNRAGSWLDLLHAKDVFFWKNSRQGCRSGVFIHAGRPLAWARDETIRPAKP